LPSQNRSFHLPIGARALVTKYGYPNGGATRLTPKNPRNSEKRDKFLASTEPHRSSVSRADHAYVHQKHQNTLNATWAQSRHRHKLLDFVPYRSQPKGTVVMNNFLRLKNCPYLCPDNISEGRRSSIPAPGPSGHCRVKSDIGARSIREHSNARDGTLH
jgi:hypothetical protein